MAQEVGLRELLEAGVHFGHQTRRWNPKMRRFIFGERSGIYLIDLLRTEAMLAQAQRFADGLARRGGTVLFVGTKKQARDGIKEIAEASGQPYVNHRWLGGLLTNFQTISLRIKRLHDLERYETEGQLQLLPTRERMAAQADLEKLRANLGGVKNMQRVPDALFVIDLKTEAIAVREAQRLRIPIIGLVDTNCDPDGIDYVIPGNDDAIKACYVITKAIGDVVQSGISDVPRRGGARPPGGRRAGAPRGGGEGPQGGRGAGAQGGRGGRRARGAHAGRRGRAARRGRGDGRRGRGRPRPPAGRGTRLRRGRRRRCRGRRAGGARQGNVGPGQREEHQNPNVGDKVPQEAGAAQGAGRRPPRRPPRRPRRRPPSVRAPARRRPSPRRPRPSRARATRRSPRPLRRRPRRASARPARRAPRAPNRPPKA